MSIPISSRRRRRALSFAALPAAFALVAGGIAIGATESAAEDTNEMQGTIASGCGTTPAATEVTMKDASWQFVGDVSIKDDKLTLTGKNTSAAVYFDEPLELTQIDCLVTAEAGDLPFFNLQVTERKLGREDYNVRPDPSRTGEWRLGNQEGSLASLQELNPELRVHAVAIRMGSLADGTNTWSTDSLRVNNTRYTFSETEMPTPSLEKLTITQPNDKTPYATAISNDPHLAFELTPPGSGATVNVTSKQPTRLTHVGDWTVKGWATVPEPVSGTFDEAAKDLGTVTINAPKGTLPVEWLDQRTKPATSETAPDGAATFAVGAKAGDIETIDYKVYRDEFLNPGDSTKPVASATDAAVADGKIVVTGLTPGRYAIEANVTGQPNFKSAPVGFFIPEKDFSRFKTKVETAADTGLGVADDDGTFRPGPNGYAKLTLTNNAGYEMLYFSCLLPKGTPHNKCEYEDDIVLPAGGSTDLEAFDRSGGEYVWWVTPTGAKTRTVPVVIERAAASGVTAPAKAVAGQAVEMSGRVPDIAKVTPELEMWLYSKPAKLATGQLSSNGSWRIRGMVPAATPAGTHTLRVVDGAGRVLAAQSITVLKSGTTDGTTTDGTKHPDLAKGGTNVLVPAMIAVGLLLAGLGIRGLAPRRIRES